MSSIAPSVSDLNPRSRSTASEKRAPTPTEGRSRRHGEHACADDGRASRSRRRAGRAPGSAALVSGRAGPGATVGGSLRLFTEVRAGDAFLEVFQRAEILDDV